MNFRAGVSNKMFPMNFWRTKKSYDILVKINKLFQIQNITQNLKSLNEKSK
jgi:hypothetical protein